jgi:hypothetical protein
MSGDDFTLRSAGSLIKQLSELEFERLNTGLYKESTGIYPPNGLIDLLRDSQ